MVHNLTSGKESPLLFLPASQHSSPFTAVTLSEIHQLPFLFPCKLLNLVFSAHCFFLCGKTFKIYQCYRPFRLRVFRTVFSLIMSFQAFLHTVCLKCPVCTLNHIRVVHDRTISISVKSRGKSPFHILLL